MTAPDLSPAEAARVAEFDAAPDAPESTVQRVADALRAEGAWCGVCDYESGPCNDCKATLRDYARAAIAAMSGAR